MGSQNTQGTGQGAAYPGQKGPGNGRNVFVPTSSAHVVAAGRVTLSSGTATVTFPTPLSGANTKYSVQLTPHSATTTVPRVTTLTDNSDSNFASFVITGNGTDSIGYAVILNGNA